MKRARGNTQGEPCVPDDDHARLLNAIGEQYSTVSPAELQLATLKMFLSDERPSQRLQRQMFRRILKEMYQAGGCKEQSETLVKYMTIILCDEVHVHLTQDAIGVFHDPAFRVPIRTMVHPPHLMLVRALHLRPFDLFHTITPAVAEYHTFLHYREPRDPPDSEEERAEVERLRQQYCFTPEQRDLVSQWRHGMARHLLVYLAELVQLTEGLGHSENQLLAGRAYMRPYVCSSALVSLLSVSLQRLLSTLASHVLDDSIHVLYRPTAGGDAPSGAIGTQMIHYYTTILTALHQCSPSRFVNTLHKLHCNHRECIYCFRSYYHMQLATGKIDSFAADISSRISGMQRDADREASRQQRQDIGALLHKFYNG